MAGRIFTTNRSKAVIQDHRLGDQPPGLHPLSLPLRKILHLAPRNRRKNHRLVVAANLQRRQHAFRRLFHDPLQHRQSDQILTSSRRPAGPHAGRCHMTVVIAVMALVVVIMLLGVPVGFAFGLGGFAILAITGLDPRFAIPAALSQPGILYPACTAALHHGRRADARCGHIQAPDRLHDGFFGPDTRGGWGWSAWCRAPSSAPSRGRPRRPSPPSDRS